MVKNYRTWTKPYGGLLFIVLVLIAVRMVLAVDPASVVVNLSDYVVAPNAIITVTPVALDSNGQVIDDPNFRYDIRIAANGITTGNAPVVMDAGQHIQFPKVVKRLINWDPRIDPDGEFADADPTDPNYGKETGGFYRVTATLIGYALSGSADVTVLPYGTAKITVKTKQYNDQLVKGLGAMVTAIRTGDRQRIIDEANRSLRPIAMNTDFGFDTLNTNQVMAPPNGYPVTQDQLQAAGFMPGPDDPPFSSTLDAIASQLNQGTNRVNAINPANVVQADVDDMRAIANNARTLEQQLRPLRPSVSGVQLYGEKLDNLFGTALPKLLDAVTAKSLAIVANLPSGAHPPSAAQGGFSPNGVFGLIGTLFGLLTDLEGTANTFALEGSISLANSMLNIILAELINRSAPPGLTIEWVQASASPSAVCPNYPNTFIGGNGFSRNEKKMKVLLIGCIDSEAISNILSLRNPGNDWAAPIRVMFTLVSIAQALGRDQSTVAARTADRIRNGLPPDWDLEAVFDNGWPRVNQGRLPCAGTIILLNLDKGTYRATNRNFFPECG